VSPRRISNKLVQESPALHGDDTIERAVERLLGSGLPALPVFDERGRLCGIFGEREFMAALFPATCASSATPASCRGSSTTRSRRERRCRGEPVADRINTEHIDVGEDFSDVGVAETFLHHPVLILPVTRGRQVIGVITRAPTSSTGWGHGSSRTATPPDPIHA
jgi:CBS domain-containing protein